MLHHALAMARNPVRRFALVRSPVDEDDLAIRLAERLGMRIPRGASKSVAWRTLERGICQCSVQGLSVILAVDDCGVLDTGEGRQGLRRLVHLGGSERARVTVLLTDEADSSGADLGLQSWTLKIGLKPLCRSEIETYLIAKLAAAGGREPIFTPHAVARLQVLSGGSPRAVDRLGTLCLMAGASRGVEAVSSELVDSVSTECHMPPELVFRG